MDDVVFSVTPNNEPLAIYVNLLSSRKNFSKVSRWSYACISSMNTKVFSFSFILSPAIVLKAK